MHYFKMFTEFGIDPKVQSLSEAMQRRLTMLFCLRCAGPTEKMDEAEIATYLRISEDDLAQTKSAFIRKGFIDENWAIRNWTKRQAYDPNAAGRQQKVRDKKRNAGATKSKRKAQPASDVTPLELELERELEKEGKRKPPAIYSEDIEDEPEEHPAYDYEPSAVMAGALPPERSGQSLVDWNAATKLLGSVDRTKHIAMEMASLAGTPSVEQLDGWRFLYAADKTVRPNAQTGWGYFLAIAQRCTKEEFDRMKSPVVPGSNFVRVAEKPAPYHQAMPSLKEKFGPVPIRDQETNN